MESRKPVSTPKPQIVASRRASAIVAIVALGGLMLYGVFLALVIPGTETSTDPERPFGYRFDPDDDAPLPNPHLVTASVWSNRPGSQPTVTLHYREGMEGSFQQVRMQRIGNGNTFAAEIGPLDKGERAFYYLHVADASGASMNIPEQAPEKPLYFVRWEGHVNWGVLALHITLMIGALFFLIHAIHFSFIAGRAPEANGMVLVGKIHRAVRWGLACFFLGGIPLGIYVSGTALGWDKAWGAWPLGNDITDTKTEILILFWFAVALLRRDVWVKAKPPTWWPTISNRAFAGSVLVGAALTSVIYAIPHSLFFQ
jgi:hypothetical protein